MEGANPDEVIAMTGNADFTVYVALALPPFPKTLEEAKKESKMKMPENVKEETLPDGWALTFDNKNGDFYVQVRREIGGKAYRCETATLSAASQGNVLKACKSLRQ